MTCQRWSARHRSLSSANAVAVSSQSVVTSDDRESHRDIARIARGVAIVQSLTTRLRICQGACHAVCGQSANARSSDRLFKLVKDMDALAEDVVKSMLSVRRSCHLRGVWIPIDLFAVSRRLPFHRRVRPYAYCSAIPSPTLSQIQL